MQASRKCVGACALAAMLLATSAHAEIYSWIDADGVTHFGERPPSSARAAEVRLKVPPADPQAAARLSAVLDAGEEALRLRLEARRAERLAERRRAELMRDCEYARGHRARLAGAQRVLTRESPRERAAAIRAQYDEDIARTDRAIGQLCL
ncbi:MAG: DUF4124 domain-containing protein [Gammaproteobacteria bacterium]